MHPRVLLRLADGGIHELVPGDIIGRQPAVALPLDDGRVSEAHAMVSLRGGQLCLLGLRGAFAIDGKPVDRVPLRPGLVITLAPQVELEVVEVVLPDDVLGIEGPDLPLRALPGVASIHTSPSLRLVRGWDQRAAAQVWSQGESWRARRTDGPARPVGAGDTLELPGHSLVFVAIPLMGAGQSVTRQGGVAEPLRIIATFDSVHIHRRERVALHLGGMLARLVSELVAFRGPVPWRMLAAELWPTEEEPDVVRSRLDTNLARLRSKLLTAGLRTDLVRSDGTGQLELVAYPGDVIEDRT